MSGDIQAASFNFTEISGRLYLRPGVFFTGRVIFRATSIPLQANHPAPASQAGPYKHSRMKRLILSLAACLAVFAWTVAGAAAQVPVYNLENEVVQRFMDKGPYAAFGSEESYFADNAAFPQKYAQDKPAAIGISWKGKAGKTYMVTVTEDGAAGGPVIRKKVQGTSYEIKNLIPQRRYAYKVQKGRKTVASGVFRTTGQVRMIAIENSCNARDLGGWTGLDGRRIRYGWLYRTGSIDGAYAGLCSDNCGGSRCTSPVHAEAQSQIGDPAMHTLSEESLDELAQIGIAADLDLRGMTNEGRWGNQCLSHSRSLGLTKIPGADFCQIMTDEALHNPLQDAAIVRDVAWIIQELKKGRPVAFHCRSGADRTGAVAMLIEALLGVSAGDIARDYELTSLSSEGKGQTRSAKAALTSSYGFFARGFTTLDVPETDPARRLQKQSYFYLNSYFADERISAADLDWFINFMLEPAA